MAEECRNTEGLKAAVRASGSVAVTTHQQANSHDQVLQTS